MKGKKRTPMSPWASQPGIHCIEQQRTALVSNRVEGEDQLGEGVREEGGGDAIPDFHTYALVCMHPYSHTPVCTHLHQEFQRMVRTDMTGSGEENDKDGRRAEDKKLPSLLTERVPRTSRASGAKGVRSPRC